jgi:hypothetical protein
MSCPRITEAFEADISADYEAHLKTCAECREARAAYLAVGKASVAPPRPAGLEAARAAAQEELKRQPVARPWWVMGLVLLGVDAMLAVALPVWMGMRSDIHAWVSAVLWWGLAVGGSLAALAPGRAWSRWAALGMGALALAVTFLGATASGTAGAATCAQLELFVSVLPVVVTLAAMMQFAFDPLRAAVAGAAAAAVGVGVLSIHCPNTAFAHLAMFHLAPWLAVTVLAAAIRRALPSRSLAP